MPSSAPLIPAAVVEAIAADRWNRLGPVSPFDRLTSGHRAQLVQDATEDAQAAYPHLLAAWMKRLQGEEVVEAIINQYGELMAPRASYRPEAEVEIERVCAALASIDSDGGTR
jgi:hypothetical protein